MPKVIATHDTEEATAEVALPTRILPAGKDAEFEVRLQSKNTAYEIGNVILQFKTRYRGTEGYEEVTVSHHILTENLSIESGLTETETRTVPVPPVLPSTIGSIDIWATILFKNGHDTFEYDAQLQVPLRAPTSTAISTMVDHDYAIQDVECTLDLSSRDCPFMQRIGFRPTDEVRRNNARKVDIFVQPNADETRLLGVVGSDNDDLESITATNNLEIAVRDGGEERIAEHLGILINRYIGL